MAGFIRLTDAKGSPLVHGGVSRNGFLGWHQFDSFQFSNASSPGTWKIGQQFTTTRVFDSVTTQLLLFSSTGKHFEAKIELIDEITKSVKGRYLASGVLVDSVIIGGEPAMENSSFSYSKLIFQY